MRLTASDPTLAEALESGNNQQLEKIIKERMKEIFDKQRAEQTRLAKLQNADPNDVEAQKMIEEEIRRNMVEQNYQNAMEHNPEFFGHITMLYIDVKVNGHPVQAFVDSGAQSTIISQQCAEACNIMHLLDKRFAGMAVGVGSSKILGRVHLGNMHIEDENPGGQGHTIQCSFTVLEDNKVDLLFGLDNLKRHQCCIDLVENKLHFARGEFSVPFLGDGSIKRNKFQDELELQKKVSSSGEATPVVKELMEMGFSKEKVLEALTICDGNKDHALNYLTSGGPGSADASPSQAGK